MSEDHPDTSPDTSPNTSTKALIQMYKSQLTEQERLVLEIAVEHLETSFDIEKSIGFIQWKASYDANQER